MAVVLDIGIKLDSGFRENESLRRLFGAESPLHALSKLGLSAAETAVSPDTDFAALTAYAETCVGAGFRVSLHPYTERTPCNPARFSHDDERCRRFHTKVFLAAEEAARRQHSEATVVIHGAAGEKGEKRRALVDESVRFFAWAKEWCLENSPATNLVVELQFRPYREETIQRIGDGYEELAEIAERAGVGVCWDFGHAFMNADRFGFSLDPPEDVLKRIVHIHCHDVNDIDHWPLVYDRVPCARMLALAIDHGFDGTVILEVPPENFVSAGGLETLVRSVDKIKTVCAARDRA